MENVFVVPQVTTGGVEHWCHNGEKLLNVTLRHHLSFILKFNKIGYCGAFLCFIFHFYCWYPQEEMLHLNIHDNTRHMMFTGNILPVIYHVCTHLRGFVTMAWGMVRVWGRRFVWDGSRAGGLLVTGSCNVSSASLIPGNLGHFQPVHMELRPTPPSSLCLRRGSTQLHANDRTERTHWRLSSAQYTFNTPRTVGWLRATKSSILCLTEPSAFIISLCSVIVSLLCFIFI